MSEPEPIEYELSECRLFPRDPVEFWLAVALQRECGLTTDEVEVVLLEQMYGEVKS